MLLQSLSRRGLHGTALEVTKLLHQLDPRDPMGTNFCINYFALRAHDYQFVQVNCPSLRMDPTHRCIHMLQKNLPASGCKECGTD